MIDVKVLHEGMRDNGYICTPLFATQVASALSSRPTRGVILKGPAGVGKSFLPEVIAKVMDIEMFWHQLSPGTHETDLLLKMYPSSSTRAGITVEKSTIYEAAIASQKKKVLLVLDEWDKSRPSADGMFLDFFQSGRLPLPPQDGKKISANLDNLLIIITMNDERAVTEPFLRRFSKIDIEQLAPTLVYKALRDTHPDHPYLENAIALYCRALVSEMEKPVTIQELRQLLDAISSLGKYADWNTLVLQFITKEPENHVLLKDAESIDLEDQDHLIGVGGINTMLSNKAYGSLPVQENDEQPVKPTLPKVSKIRKWKTDIDDTAFEDLGNDCFGVVEKTPDTYTKLAMLGNATDNPSDLDWIKNCSSSLALKKPIDLDKHIIRHDICCGGFPLNDSFGAVKDQNQQQKTSGVDEKLTSGEIMFRLPFVERSEFMRMVKWQGHILKSMTSNEIISRAQVGENGRSVQAPKYDINFRWRKNKGIDVIVPVAGMQWFRTLWQTGRRSYIIDDGQGDYLHPANDFFVAHMSGGRRVPWAHVRSLRHYSNVAKYGLTVVSDHRGTLFQKTAREIQRLERKVFCSSTDEVNPDEHFYHPTDWVCSNAISIGRWENRIGDMVCEVRINGSYSLEVAIEITQSGYALPFYVPVKCNARKLLRALSRGIGFGTNRFYRNTGVNQPATVRHNRLNFTSCGDSIGYFWSNITPAVGDSRATWKRRLSTMMRRLDYYQRKYNGFK
tara:strand:+ start:11431 stop:13626 length:2196 start_codon:yes stop_codon:yes gene_type:complete